MARTEGNLALRDQLREEFEKPQNSKLRLEATDTSVVVKLRVGRTPTEPVELPLISSLDREESKRRSVG